MFTVRWKRSVLNELATLWMQADSGTRELITRATSRLDQQLQNDPGNQSESRGGMDRVCFVFPLGVRFEVDHVKRVVHVLHVWSYRRKI